MLDVNNLLGWQSKTPQRSMVRVTDPTPSTPATTRTFATTISNIGNDIVYQRDAVSGDAFRIVSPGVYAMTYCENFSAGAYLGISLNAQVAVDVTSLPQKNVLVYTQAPSANVPVTVSVTVPLMSGDIIRAHSTANNTGSAGSFKIFTIARVSD